MTNKFSIILPVRNGINYVKECVTSILQQTFKDFNLIILDNNSSDGTYEWLQSLNSEKIIIHRTTKDLDINANWRRANFINTNEFVTFIGHDDRYHSNYLSSINELISKFPDASIYQTKFHYIDSTGKFVRECKPMQEKILVQDFLKGQFTNTMDSMGTGYVFRYKDFKKLDGFSDNYPNLIFSDYQLYVELTGLSYLAVSPLYTFDYRLHKSLSITTDAENYRIAFEKYIFFLKDYMQQNQSVKNIVYEYGYYFLMYHCQSLSHRLLKSAETLKRIKVSDYIKKCKEYAGMLHIKQNFVPEKNIKILSAEILDKSIITRTIFKNIRKRLN